MEKVVQTEVQGRFLQLKICRFSKSFVVLGAKIHQ